MFVSWFLVLWALLEIFHRQGVAEDSLKSVSLAPAAPGGTGSGGVGSRLVDPKANVGASFFGGPRFRLILAQRRMLSVLIL